MPDGSQQATQELLANQLGDDVMVYVTPASVNKPEFADDLGNQHPLAGQITVLSVSQLSDPTAAHREVKPWPSPPDPGAICTFAFGDGEQSHLNG